MPYQNGYIFLSISIFLFIGVAVGQKSTWGRWGPWSGCSVTCGYGVIARVAYWIDEQGRSTNKSIVDHGGCYNDKPCPVNGNWTMWSPWRRCSAICGPGTWTRTRSCNNPTPANGGLDCSGPDSETEECNVQPCPKIPAGFKLSSCTTTDFMCESQRQCVPPSQRCDRKLQCHDGTDEKLCPINRQSSLHLTTAWAVILSLLTSYITKRLS